jgi:hypothetical protein
MEQKNCEFCQTQQARLSRHEPVCRVRYLILNPNQIFVDTLIKYGLFNTEKDKFESEINLLQKRIHELEFKLQIFSEEKVKLENNLTSVISTNFPTTSIIKRKFGVEIFENKVSSQKLRQLTNVWESYKLWVNKSRSNSDFSMFEDDSYLLNVNLANSFIKSLSNSTALQHKQTLKFLLSNFMQFPVRLMRLNTMELDIKPKFNFEQDHLHNYLREQFKINYQDYVIQVFLSTFGLRINTPCILQAKHLRDLSKNLIYLPDLKTRTTFVSNISNKLKFFLTHYLESTGIQSPEAFIFYPKHKDYKMRLQTLKQKINRRIKASFKEKNLLPDGFTLSSHIFRKTNCFNYFNNELKELIKNAGLHIGHKKGSHATLSYIYSNDHRWLPENSVPLILGDGQELTEDEISKNINQSKEKSHYLLRKRIRKKIINEEESIQIKKVRPRIKMKIKSKFSQTELLKFY